MRKARYIVNRKNDGKFFPKVDRWVMDTFNLKLQETILYGLILTKGFIVWDYGFIANVLNMSKPTVFRLIDGLVKKEIIEKRVKLYDGNKQRAVIVSLYTSEGLREDWEIENMFRLGFEKLDSYYKD